MSSQTEIIPAQNIAPLIRVIRDTRVILDADLAGIYGVPTKRLNEQFRRNLRFSAYRSGVGRFKVANCDLKHG